MNTKMLVTVLGVAVAAWSVGCGGPDADSPKAMTSDGSPSTNGAVPSNGTMGPGGSMNNGSGPAGTMPKDPSMGGNSTGSSSSAGASGGPMGTTTMSAGGAVGRDLGDAGPGVTTRGRDRDAGMGK